LCLNWVLDNCVTTFGVIHVFFNIILNVRPSCKLSILLKYNLLSRFLVYCILEKLNGVIKAVY
jgi:hypothetical protein